MGQTKKKKKKSLPIWNSDFPEHPIFFFAKSVNAGQNTLVLIFIIIVRFAQ